MKWMRFDGDLDRSTPKEDARKNRDYQGLHLDPSPTRPAASHDLRRSCPVGHIFSTRLNTDDLERALRVPGIGIRLPIWNPTHQHIIPRLNSHVSAADKYRLRDTLLRIGLKGFSLK